MQHFLHRWNDEQKEVEMQDAPFAKNYEPEMASGIAMKEGATYMDNRAMIRAKQNQNKLEKSQQRKLCGRNKSFKLLGTSKIMEVEFYYGKPI